MAKIIEIQERKINGTWYPGENGLPIVKRDLEIENANGLLTRYKIIYDWKSKTEKEIRDILELEIRGIMNDNPGYKMHKAWKQFNEDGSITYGLQLKHKLFK